MLSSYVDLLYQPITLLLNICCLRYLKERDICMEYFSGWTEQDQIEFVEELLVSMHHHQHGTVNAFLKPMLQRDFISLLPKKVT